MIYTTPSSSQHQTITKKAATWKWISTKPTPLSMNDWTIFRSKSRLSTNRYSSPHKKNTGSPITTRPVIYLEQDRPMTNSRTQLQRCRLWVPAPITNMFRLMTQMNKTFEAQLTLGNPMVPSVHSVSRRGLSTETITPSTFMKSTNAVSTAHPMFLKAVKLVARADWEPLLIEGPIIVMNSIHLSSLVLHPKEVRTLNKKVNEQPPIYPSKWYRQRHQQPQLRQLVQ